MGYLNSEDSLKGIRNNVSSPTCSSGIVSPSPQKEYSWNNITRLLRMNQKMLGPLPSSLEMFGLRVAML